MAAAELLTFGRHRRHRLGSRFEWLDGVGHFLHLEQPDRVAELICGWLTSGP